MTDRELAGPVFCVKLQQIQRSVAKKDLFENTEPRKFRTSAAVNPTRRVTEREVIDSDFSTGMWLSRQHREAE